MRIRGGHHLEPGEVERGLCRHHEVRESAVLASGEGEDSNLVAFVVLEHATTPKELRAHAEAELPHHMVPKYFVQLACIPVHEDGTRDLVALHDLMAEYRARRERSVPPVTPVEIYLAGQWKDLLGVDQVGRDDDFFALGGNSLLVFRMLSRIRRDRFVTADYEMMLRHTMLADLAAYIDELEDGDALI